MVAAESVSEATKTSLKSMESAFYQFGVLPLLLNSILGFMREYLPSEPMTIYGFSAITGDESMVEYGWPPLLPQWDLGAPGEPTKTTFQFPPL